MPRDASPNPARRPAAGALPALGCLALLVAGGCANNPGREPARPEPVRVASADSEASRLYLAELAELADSPPARQAELLKNARDQAESAPTTTNRLRYALFLADPGHGGSDPVAARRQLSEILARPEWALPSERALAAFALRETEARLAIADDGKHAVEVTSSRDHDKLAAATRRLSAEQEENARLKKALDDAQKKLDAVTQLERAAKGRDTAPGGT